MNLIEAWKAAKLGQKIQIEHSELGPVVIKKEDFNYVSSIPNIPGMTMESFMADDWKLVPPQEFTLENVKFYAHHKTEGSIWPTLVDKTGSVRSLQDLPFDVLGTLTFTPNKE